MFLTQVFYGQECITRQELYIIPHDPVPATNEQLDSIGSAMNLLDSLDTVDLRAMITLSPEMVDSVFFELVSGEGGSTLVEGAFELPAEGSEQAMGEYTVARCSQCIAIKMNGHLFRKPFTVNTHARQANGSMSQQYQVLYE